MAQARSRRLRKKLHTDEFQEIGFTVSFSFKEGTTIEAVDEMLDTFVKELIIPNGLVFEGSGYLNWEGIICLQKIGHCTEEHRKLVTDWLNSKELLDVTTSEMFDIWWG